jgi:ATP citrate (pro-S)-lyase
MSAKAIREATGKDLLNRFLSQTSGAGQCRFASVDENTKWEALVAANPWLQTEVCLFLILLFWPAFTQPV